MYINIYFWGRPPVPEGCDLRVGGLVARVHIRAQDTVILWLWVVSSRSRFQVYEWELKNRLCGRGGCEVGRSQELPIA